MAWSTYRERFDIAEEITVELESPAKNVFSYQKVLLKVIF